MILQSYASAGERALKNVFKKFASIDPPKNKFKQPIRCIACYVKSLSGLDGFQEVGRKIFTVIGIYCNWKQLSCVNVLPVYYYS